MKELKYSEDPIYDIWQRLLKYSYISNIEKYLGSEYNEKFLNKIAGSIIQSFEYFNVFKNVSLNTSPLQLYYGYVNLLYAVSCLKLQKSIEIKNHGLSLSFPEKDRSIGNIIINLSESTDGAFKTFNDIFSDDVKFPNIITIKEILGFIPEIKNEFEDCYTECDSACIPIEVIKRKGDTVERILKSQLNGRKFDPEKIAKFTETYLVPQETNEYFILRKKLISNKIGIHAISGQKFLLKYIENDSKNYSISQIMMYFLALYSFSVLSRYHPDKWYPFVQYDNSGEKGLIQDFLSIAYRKLPNLLLNKLQNREIVFSTDKVGYTDMSKYFNSDEIKNIVHDEIKNVMRR